MWGSRAEVRSQCRESPQRAAAVKVSFDEKKIAVDHTRRDAFEEKKAVRQPTPEKKVLAQGGQPERERSREKEKEQVKQDYPKREKNKKYLEKVKERRKEKARPRVQRPIPRPVEWSA